MEIKCIEKNTCLFHCYLSIKRMLNRVLGITMEIPHLNYMWECVNEAFSPIFIQTIVVTIGNTG